MKFKVVECKNNQEKIWIICSEEGSHKSFLINKKDLYNFLLK